MRIITISGLARHIMHITPESDGGTRRSEWRAGRVVRTWRRSLSWNLVQLTWSSWPKATSASTQPGRVYRSERCLPAASACESAGAIANWEHGYHLDHYRYSQTIVILPVFLAFPELQKWRSPHVLVLVVLSKQLITVSVTRTSQHIFLLLKVGSRAIRNSLCRFFSKRPSS